MMSESARRTAQRFALHQFIHWAAIGVMVPIMTLVFRRLGLTLFEVGLATAAYSLTTVILEVPSGALADLWGRKKTYLLGTFSDIAAVVLLLSFRGLGMVVVAAALRGAGRAFSSGSLEALAVETIRRGQPDFDLNRFFSRVGMTIPAGLAATSLLGGFLPELADLPVAAWLVRVSPAEDFSVNLLVNAALTGAAGLLSWFMFAEPRRRPSGSASGPPGWGGEDAADVRGAIAVLRQVGGALRFAAKTRDLLRVLLSSFAVGLVLHSVEIFWQPRLASIIVTDNVRLFGFLGSGYFAVAVVGSGLSPLLVRVTRGNRAMAVILYRALSAAILVVLALQTRAEGFGIAYLGFFFLYASTTPIQATMLNELVPDSKRATLISASSLIMQGGGFLGALLFGAVSQSAGIGVSWMMAAGAFALSTLLFVPLARRARLDREISESATAGAC
ncbi:MAG: MFS transporter [Spirochaetaceae bacterium]